MTTRTYDRTATFEALKAILEPFEPHLVKVYDEPGNYYLDTTHVQPNRKPLFFGAVQATKHYVAFHLMPLYTHLDLLETMSPALRKRMQGKSCLNFTEVEPALLRELGRVTRAAFRKYKALGYVRQVRRVRGGSA